MKISKELPPNYALIKETFALSERVVFTYGDTIYNPNDGQIDPPLLAHEMTHSIQQGTDPELWWKQYLISVDFRLAQEVPAYQNQYKQAQKYIKDRNQLTRYATKLAQDLSSPLYGSIISFRQAFEAIKKKELYTFKV